MRSLALRMALSEEHKLEIGRRIRRLRELDGRTIRVLADEIPVSTKAWGNWENGTSEPRYEHFEAIARLFKKDVDYIRFGEQGPTPDLFGQDGTNPLEEVHRKLDEILRRLPAEEKEPETKEPEIDEVDPALRPGGPGSPPDEEDLGEQAS